MSQFLGAFDVDLADVLGQREAEFAFGLADAGIHDAGGGDAGGAGAAEFALADHVGAGALAAEQRQRWRGGRWPSPRSAACGVEAGVASARAARAR